MAAENIRAMEKNRALTATLLELTGKIQAQQDRISEDSECSAQLEKARDDARTARQRWRMMKSVVAAIVAGSGVDWARDDSLRDLVLDEEKEAD